MTKSRAYLRVARTLLVVAGLVTGCESATRQSARPAPAPLASEQRSPATAASRATLVHDESTREPAHDAGARDAAMPHDAGAADASTEAHASEQAATRITTTSDPVAALLALPASATTSLGAPADGRLENAVALPDSGPGFIFNPKRPHDARYGTVELVQAIVRAAGDVERSMPGSGLVVNDLSLREGGPIRQHGSHQSGRDADILFYALDAKNRPMPAVGVSLDPTGRGWDFKDLADPKDDVRVKLDAKRTWRFMRGLLEHGGDHVQRIFIVEHVRSLLVAEAERAKAPKAVRERFEMLTCQPGTPHDDHMHVRFFCTPDDMARGCVDSSPVYPFRRRALAAVGLKPALEPFGARAARRAAVDSRTTSLAEAREKTKHVRMHARVREFLDRQESWGEQPHPGRPYCR